MADLFVVEQLQTYLVDQGVGQLPGGTPNVAIPSIWIQPRDGAPLPREGEKVTITLVDTFLRPAAALEAFLQETFVQVTIRSQGASLGKLAQRSIHNLVVPLGISGGRMHWTMNDLLVQYSDQINEMQDPQVTDKGVYTRTATYRFGVRRTDLAGV